MQGSSFITKQSFCRLFNVFFFYFKSSSIITILNVILETLFLYLHYYLKALLTKQNYIFFISMVLNFNFTFVMKYIEWRRNT